MNDAKARVLLADDHDLVRESLRLLLIATGRAEVSLARDVDEALALIASADRFDLILLDYWMPGMNGTEGLSRVIEAAGDAPVAILSGNLSGTLAEEVLRIGARGVIPKSITGKSFVNALNFMISGEVYVPATLQQALSGASQPNGFGLTPQETRVLSRLAHGLTNKEIAKEMDLSEVTVKMHVRSMLRKVGASNRTQAALIARRAGIH
jgi:two-component system, NarL family, nitrate/nitrite response regulator NarL